MNAYDESTGIWTCHKCGRYFKVRPEDLPITSHPCKPRGLGDQVAVFIAKTVPYWTLKILGVAKGCGGCRRRQEFLNRILKSPQDNQQAGSEKGKNAQAD